MSRSPQRPPYVTQAALLFGATLLMLWPALYNGQAFFTTDTSAYVRAADAGITRLTGHATGWTPSADAPAPRAAEAPAIAGTEAPAAEPPGTEQQKAAEPSLSERTIFAGRSVYYGLLTYIGYIAGNFWLTLVVQALVFVGLIATALRLTDVPSNAKTFAALAVLLVTPAPMFASLLMPDGFAAACILATTLLVLPIAKSRAVVWGLFVVLAAGLSFHSSHLLVTIALLGAAIVAFAIDRSWLDRKGAALVVGALVLAVLAESAFNFSVTKLLGQAPVRPPFLMARVLEDGPGERYLKATCPGSGYEVCRFVDRMPTTVNNFLWSEQRPTGVFSAEDAATRRRLSAEQTRFFIGAVTFEPWQQLKASVRNAWYQATAIGVPGFVYSASDRDVLLSKAPADTEASLRKTRAFAETFPVGPLTATSQLSAIVALSYIGWALLRRKSRENSGKNSWANGIAVYVVLGVLANAFVCGALSGPFDRYQARVIWLLPLAALILALGRGRERSQEGRVGGRA